MLKVYFNHTRIIDNFKYEAKKTYEFDDKYAKHPYFLALVNNKNVMVTEGSELLETNHHAFPKKVKGQIASVPETKMAVAIEDQDESSESKDDASLPFEEKAPQPKPQPKKG